MNRKNKRKRPPSQRLLTDSAKKELLSNMRKCTIKFTELVSKSEESPKSKKQLAEFLVAILSILDLEEERIAFELIKKKKAEGTF